MSCARPNDVMWTNGKWVMSMKLSVRRVAEQVQASTGLLMRRNSGSSSWTIVGMSAAGSSRHTHTTPYRSAQWNTGRWPVGGTGTPGSADGTFARRPPSPNSQPWYGQTR